MEQRVVTHHSLRLVQALVLAFVEGVVHMGCDAGVSDARGFFFDQVDEKTTAWLALTVSLRCRSDVDAKEFALTVLSHIEL